MKSQHNNCFINYLLKSFRTVNITEEMIENYINRQICAQFVFIKLKTNLMAKRH